MRNMTLWVGLSITLLMVAIGLFGPQWAPYEADYRLELDYFINEKGEPDMIAPPLPPGSPHLLGTDWDGYDILTIILYGAKYTVFLSLGIAFVRVFVGGALGMALGYFGRSPVERKGTTGVLGMLNGIPLFLIAYFILFRSSFNNYASPVFLSLVMAVILILVGLPSVTTTVMDKTRELKRRPYILASQSLGAGHWRMIRTHISLHLRESFLVLFVNEVIMVLTIFGQLAIFNIFVGGTIHSLGLSGTDYISRTNEWSGLIGEARYSMNSFQWMFWSPLTFYSTLIVGCYLVSKGLESYYKQKYSRYSHV
ncbi:ABC transporter permease [Paenibacillus sp.]|uniref:ABC transporter permease n=1 Tax=Paenibacillus sp. TaxID=58172 RepID=UPI002D63718A|nr:ABC transporter permease subunit [Paenibacillus sp.]HZG58756.1 ABC transporter permease subunit [Paenibacillus sp.]